MTVDLFLSKIASLYIKKEARTTPHLLLKLRQNLKQISYCLLNLPVRIVLLLLSMIR